MGVLLGLVFLVCILYYFVKRSKQKDRELDQLLESIVQDKKNVSASTSHNTDSATCLEKQIVFRYKDWDGKTYTKRIIPFHKSDRFLEGYCLDTRENDLFDLDKIVSFQDGGRQKFEALGCDPNIMTHDEVTDKSSYNRPTAVTKKAVSFEDKSHKDWNEENPTEIFFRYRNVDGKTKNRIVQLINYDSQEIKGFCKMAKGLRTFKFDRIQTFYKDSKNRLEAFKENPHFNRDLLTISFVGFRDQEFEDYKAKGSIYNYRALKSITKNTGIVVSKSELTEIQSERAVENQCGLLRVDKFSHFLETGEIC